MEQKTFKSAVMQFSKIITSGEFSRFQLSCSTELAIDEIISLLSKIRQDGNRVYIVGNGGSSAVAGHICTDLLNVCKVSSQTLHETPALTCFSNDYGYEHVYSKQLEVLARPDDLLIAISSSGRSENIINASLTARKVDMKLFTLTGFDKSNPLRRVGDWNYWLESQAYGEIEIGHLFLLHHIINRCISDLCILSPSQQKDVGLEMEKYFCKEKY